jgi:hypothetical protein
VLHLFKKTVSNLTKKQEKLMFAVCRTSSQMILTVSAFGTYGITVLTILYGLLNAKPDISTKITLIFKELHMKVKFSLLFSVLIHPLYQILWIRRFLTGRAFEVNSFLDNIVNGLTQMYATKLVRAWGVLRATTVGARVGTL